MRWPRLPSLRRKRDRFTLDQLGERVEGELDTGEIKIGCFLGDHVKTGIGLLLNTGTVVGAGSNLYGALLPPTFVPPFSWGSGTDLTEYRLDKFLEVAERSMKRRDVTLTEGQRAQLSRAWERSRGAGNLALRVGDHPPGRRRVLADPRLPGALREKATKGAREPARGAQRACGRSSGCWRSTSPVHGCSARQRQSSRYPTCRKLSPFEHLPQRSLHPP